MHPASPAVPADPDPALAAGIRALLLTDVVDSTRMSELIGDQAMAQVWAAHDRLARDLLPARQGLEIDKTDGMERPQTLRALVDGSYDMLAPAEQRLFQHLFRPFVCARLHSSRSAP